MTSKIVLRLLADTLGMDADTLTLTDPHTDLADLGLTSLQFIRFIVATEEALDIEIRDSDLLMANFQTVDDILRTLSKYQKPIPELKKVLICDCDHVLWRGIAGEEYIAIHDHHRRFQRMLIELYEHGILICLCSRNHPAWIEEALSDSAMLLKESHITLKKIGHGDKLTYIRQIAQELGLSADSFVFTDDSDYELGLIASTLPEVTVIKADYRDLSFIDAIKACFAQTPMSDASRTQQYKEQKMREKEKQKFQSVEEYNASLQTVIVCEKARMDQAARISELSQRTNQCNLSAARFSPEDIAGYMQSDEYRVYTLCVADKYGDMGLVGSAIIKRGIVIAFFVSCRVFGRGIEKHLLMHMLNDSRDELKGLYRDNGKNRSYRHFYEENGVSLVE